MMYITPQSECLITSSRDKTLICTTLLPRTQQNTTENENFHKKNPFLDHKMKMFLTLMFKWNLVEKIFFENIS